MNQVPAAESRAGFWALGLACLWAGAVLAYYFGSIGPAFSYIPAAFNTNAFPPFEITKALGIWGESCLILAATFLISAVTLVWGRRLRLFFGIEPGHGWLRWGTDFGLGMAFLDLLWLGTGLARLWFGSFLWCLAGLLGLEAVWSLVRLWKEKMKGPTVSWFTKEPGYWALVFLGIFYWLFSIAHGLVPEGFYDSMVYHLAVPHFWLLNHGLCDFPTNFFSNYPYGGELFYLNGFFCQGTESAKMLHVVGFGFCALFAGGWAWEAGGEKAGWLTLGLALTLPLLTINIWTTQVEGLLALALVLFLYFFFQGFHPEKPSPGAMAAAGLFMALAFSIKYTAALVVASALPAMWMVRPAFLGQIRWRSHLVFLLGTVLLLAPWMLKNLSFTGNPFFPYFMGLFEGRHLTPAGYETLLTEQQGRIAHGWQWLILPWKAVMANPDGFNFSGPLALAFIPFLFLFRFRHPVLRFLLIILLLFFFSGFLVTHILRFLGTGFILAYILLGVVLGGGNKPHWGKGLAWAGSVTALLCFGYLSAISARYSGCAGVWSGRQTRAEYLMNQSKITPYFQMAQWIEGHSAPDARLLVVGDARGLYYDRPFLSNTVFDGQELAVLARDERNSQGIGHRLKELGIDDLVVNGPEGIRVSSDYHHYDLTPQEWKKLDDFIQKNTEIVYQENYRVVYHLLSAPRTGLSPEIFDLVLFFSKPASEFIKNAQSRQWQQAGENLNEALKLYPFSGFWKAQQAQFDKAMEGIKPG
ncbi:MAG TPA: hypothetical protein VK859_05865 [bacterium]|jgi:hypothetical protein|nr:hypothetical protein [bacterium]